MSHQPQQQQFLHYHHHQQQSETEMDRRGSDLGSVGNRGEREQNRNRTNGGGVSLDFRNLCQRIDVDSLRGECRAYFPVQGLTFKPLNFLIYFPKFSVLIL